MSPGSAIAAQIAQQQLYSSKRMQALTLLCRVYIGMSFKNWLYNPDFNFPLVKYLYLLFYWFFLFAVVYHIGSINYEVKEEIIRGAFSCYGPIRSLSMSFDPGTQRHKGFSFLEYVHAVFT